MEFQWHIQHRDEWQIQKPVIALGISHADNTQGEPE